jgi:hypothetical protein
LFYAIGMESKLALPRPSGFGGIQPGESAELLLPLSQGGALTAEINAVILEDRTAVGDETVIASMFRQRLAYASEWERWALVMRGGSSRRASPAGRDAERAEILRGLGAASDERGDAATVAGRVAARKALRTLLVETQPENRASLLEYVEERAALLRLHARREGAVASFIPAVAGGGRASGRRNASVRPATSAVRREEFSCRYPGQLFGIVGHSDVLDGGTGTAQARSVSKVDELGATAIGACGVGSYVPTCNPEFFTTTSSSPSSATIMGVSATYVAGLGCAISASQTTTLVNRGRVREQFIPVNPCPPLPPPPPPPPADFSISPAQTVEDGGAGQFSVTILSGSATSYQWSFTAPSGAGNGPNVGFTAPNDASTGTDAHWFALPNGECTASFSSAYTIRALVGFVGTGSKSKHTSLTVTTPSGAVGWVPFGFVTIMGTPFIQEGADHIWRVAGQGFLTRYVPDEAIFIPPSSQFYNKVKAHEDKHMAQLNPGGLFGNYYSVASYYARIQNLSAPSQQELSDLIRDARAQYDRDQAAFADNNRNQAEREAYAVSDPIAPRYLYQNCGRY